MRFPGVFGFSVVVVLNYLTEEKKVPASVGPNLKPCLINLNLARTRLSHKKPRGPRKPVGSGDRDWRWLSTGVRAGPR